jgi:membrane protein YdbS with pleckstrin-like domain
MATTGCKGMQLILAPRRGTAVERFMPETGMVIGSRTQRKLFQRSRANRFRALPVGPGHELPGGRARNRASLAESKGVLCPSANESNNPECGRPAMSYTSRHLMSGETVVREAHLNRIIYLPAAALFALSIGVFAVIQREGTVTRETMIFPAIFVAAGIVVLFSAMVRRSSSEFAVTNKRVLVKIGIMRRHSTEILLRQVEGITVDQGILGRIFGFGTIVVEGTGSDRTPYRGIAGPMQFRLAVQEQIERSLAQPDGAAAPKSDPYSTLLKLNELRDKGIVTDEEFAREKKKLLGE